MAILAAALAVGLVVAAGAALESRRALSPGARARVHRALAAVAVALLVVLLAGGWAAAGDPLTRARHAWDTFKSPTGYGANATAGSRLTSGLGSNRYDFYRVALDEFAAHPLVGIGADNFAEPYLAHGRSNETPRYPHSVELRTLAETGLLGALLAVVGLGAALVACRRCARDATPTRSRAPSPRLRWRASPTGPCTAPSTGSGSSPGLGAPAFALLGLGCALAPRVSSATAASGSGAEPSPAVPETTIPGRRAVGAPARLRRSTSRFAAGARVCAALACASSRSRRSSRSPPRG